LESGSFSIGQDMRNLAKEPHKQLSYFRAAVSGKCFSGSGLMDVLSGVNGTSKELCFNQVAVARELLNHLAPGVSVDKYKADAKMKMKPAEWGEAFQFA